MFSEMDRLRDDARRAGERGESMPHIPWRIGLSDRVKLDLAYQEGQRSSRRNFQLDPSPGGWIAAPTWFVWLGTTVWKVGPNVPLYIWGIVLASLVLVYAMATGYASYRFVRYFGTALVGLMWGTFANHMRWGSSSYFLWVQAVMSQLVMLAAFIVPGLHYYLASTRGIDRPEDAPTFGDVRKRGIAAYFRERPLALWLSGATSVIVLVDTYKRLPFWFF